MFAQRIDVLTHDLKHQCRIGDMSNCPASCIANSAPYLQGSYSIYRNVAILFRFSLNPCRYIHAQVIHYRVILGSGRKFSDYYELKEVIGTGGFGSVYGGICKENKQSVSVTCSSKPVILQLPNIYRVYVILVIVCPTLF